MRIYKVKEDYIEYLKVFDKNVRDNKGEKRPYIGIVLDIKNFKYFAPLASPKLKHKKMKNSIDFIKIDNGDLGAINLNNMIPINEVSIIEYDITKEENSKYSELLKNQLNFINSNSKLIKEKSQKLYVKVTEYNSFINKRCCDFRLLESKCLEYDKYIDVKKDEVAVGLVDRISAVTEKAEEYNNKIKENKIIATSSQGRALSSAAPGRRR